LEGASVFLSDVENLINHCFEQFVEIHRLSVDSAERSDAWGVVTIYYYAFFAAQALLRLLGRPVLYLDPEVLKPLKALAAPNPIPGAGSFRVSLLSVFGPTDAEFELKRLDSRSHNAVWAELFRTLRDELASVKGTAAISAQEEIFYSALCSSAAHRLYVNDEWPARIRHRANYVPGFCYQLVEGNVVAKCKHLVDGWRRAEAQNFHVLVDAPVRNFRACSEGDFGIHVKLLSDVGHGLFALVRHLYLDLCGRREFDKRWENRRTTFLKRRSVLDDYLGMFSGTRR
jgi:hypothetical protein